MKYKSLKCFLGLAMLLSTVGVAHSLDRQLASLLTQAVDAVNETSPTMLDNETRLEGAATYADYIIYTNTMVNYTVDQFNPDDFDRVIVQEVINTLCANPDLALFKQFKVKMVYRYLDKNGRYISEQSKDMGTCD